MFTKLGDFSIKRTAKQAIGFYLAYLVLLMLGVMVLTIIIATVTGRKDDFDFGVMIGQVAAIISSLAISMFILAKKNMLNGNNILLLMLALLSGLLAYLGGGMLGLIPAAYLSTK